MNPSTPASFLGASVDTPLAELAEPDFATRHIGPSDAEVAEMLELVGAASTAALIDETVPDAIQIHDPLDLGAAVSEGEAIERLRTLASENQVMTSLIGTGYHHTVTPPVIRRNVLENPAWYTAYTPYQPEISQGRLEALLNFQTMVADLAGLDMANASMLDEGTAAAEAMTLLHRMSKNQRTRFVVDQDCHPQTIAVVQTRAEPLGIEVVLADRDDAFTEDVFGVLLQYPGTTGEVYDLAPIVDAAHQAGALVAVAADLLSLVLLKSPGEAGADAVVGSAQRFGVPMGFGGPHAGFLATRENYRRSLPGRLVGMSVDAEGRPALRLALQTREQHIRREKATSNICTAQVLLAVIAGLYASWHGPDGLQRIAARTARLAATFAAGITDAGFALAHDAFFDTVTVVTGSRTDEIMAHALDAGVNLRRVDDERIGVSFDESSDAVVAELVWKAFGIDAAVEDVELSAAVVLSEQMLRTDEILDHDVFHSYRTETEMLRYLRKLSDKDIALDRSMIPLGSCTMKLNATTEMEPITWPEFANIHPFAPSEQTVGYRRMITELEQMLVEITGYHSVSLQPNAGSQGEFAGLLAIRSYHRANGDTARTVCLIPESAHGTNAASAVMAGMKVVVVATDDHGNVDMTDLTAKAEAHHDDLAAIMVTYPSTHGVFETQIREICDVIHAHGGQVYLDGANLNAMVGVAKPGHFGADVSHLNLHKTFCIPHGGGGPGVGPIGVGEHLAPFMPNHPFAAEAGPQETGCGVISAAPWGSAGILPIPWAYITLMGASGLRRATEIAILSANYMAARLDSFFPVLYRGENGRVAHECIIDLRPAKELTGISVDDVAKRLIDFGFHAPTMSFPVPGTLMIEPTESESKDEIDRFCDAMIAIAGEIAKVAAGDWTAEDNPLVHAPHTADAVTADDWTHSYGRELAAYPVASLRAQKVWAPVARVDGAHGDKNLVCSCPPMSSYESVDETAEVTA